MELMPAESFLAGIKPSCYENMSRVPIDVLRKLERFPRFSVFPGYDIFFRDEQSRNEFAEAVVKIPRDSAEFHRILGLALGFPPRAVDFYVKRVSGEISLEQFYEQKVGLYHAGVWCTGHKRDIVVNMRWLWERYPYNDKSRVATYYNNDRQAYPIQYGDYEALHNLAEALNKTPTTTA
ncbi:hypothetical protein H1164_03715 [Thermoactinomyces daqus]|uniref:Uncharacterized protein n=1 Tax=Thermoactinomyces daqus TaxID=1329516 RepID=A0A7W2AHN6_9BACL|nr:hypothetical protein [Thermoactinomyces daqus]MBA4542008.1 hypothetical protein [Thermoactinomyces daqus]